MLVTYFFFFFFRLLNDHLFGKELFIWFTASAFRKLLSHIFSYFPFGFEGRVWDLILTVPIIVFTLHPPRLVLRWTKFL